MTKTMMFRTEILGNVEKKEVEKESTQHPVIIINNFWKISFAFLCVIFISQG